MRYPAVVLSVLLMTVVIRRSSKKETKKVFVFSGFNFFPVTLAALLNLIVEMNSFFFSLFETEKYEQRILKRT